MNDDAKPSEPEVNAMLDNNKTNGAADGVSDQELAYILKLADARPLEASRQEALIASIMAKAVAAEPMRALRQASDVERSNAIVDFATASQQRTVARDAQLAARAKPSSFASARAAFSGAALAACLVLGVMVGVSDLVPDHLIATVTADVTVASISPADALFGTGEVDADLGDDIL